MAKIKNLYFYNLEGVDKLPSNIMAELFNSDELFKLLKFNDGAPLESSKTITINDKKAMLNQEITNSDRRIFFSAFNDAVIDKEQAQLRIYNCGFSPKSNILYDQYVGFDIVCHNNLVNIKDEENKDSDRLIKIFQILMEKLNGNVIEGGIGVLEPLYNREIPLLTFNQSFQGYRFKMRLKGD